MHTHVLLVVGMKWWWGQGIITGSIRGRCRCYSGLPLPHRYRETSFDTLHIGRTADLGWRASCRDRPFSSFPVVVPISRFPHRKWPVRSSSNRMRSPTASTLQRKARSTCTWLSQYIDRRWNWVKGISQHWRCVVRMWPKVSQEDFACWDTTQFR